MESKDIEQLKKKSPVWKSFSIFLEHHIEYLKVCDDSQQQIRIVLEKKSKARNCCMEFESEYNKLPPENLHRAQVFAAIVDPSKNSLRVKTLAANNDLVPLEDFEFVMEDPKLQQAEKSCDQDIMELEEMTIRELSLGKREEEGFLALRVLFCVSRFSGQKLDLIVQDTESTVVFAEIWKSVMTEAKLVPFKKGSVIFWRCPLIFCCVGNSHATLICNEPSNVMSTVPSHLERHPLLQKCDVCGKFLEKKLRCGRCKIAQFCSQECSAKAWPKHKHSCFA